MKCSTLTGWMLLIATGFCLSSQSLLAADKNGVIIDPTWTILIRPAKRAPQTSASEIRSWKQVDLRRLSAVFLGDAPTWLRWIQKPVNKNR